MQKYAGKTVRLNQGSNSQPPGHESNMLTTEPSRRGLKEAETLDRLIDWLNGVLRRF